MLNMADKGSTDENERQKIKHLDTSVVNRIAAGEIIIQPANALKELLENSIDAESTMIDILIKDGGLKLLQISDNGHGINKDDMSLLCERFTTSKLSKFEDLESISTYGFRGEALASISHIARLSVITKTKLSQLAYKAYYLNGKLTNANFKADVSNIEPKPIAGKDGTQIIVEDLFYNVPSRLKTLKSKNDEFSKILDVIGRYAVHTEGVGFSCKKFGESYQVLVTRPTMTLTERIRTIFGPAVANELIDIEIKGNGTMEEDYKGKYGLVRVSGAITNSNYNNKKKIQPVFFINHRLVACEPLKRAISSIYQFFLPKGNQPFMYLSLEIEPQNLDVNVHPTKREVRFLYEDEIIEIISAKVHQLLSSIDSSRKFKTQNILSNRQDLKRSNDEFSELSREYTLNESLSQPAKKYRQENKLVRVDAQQSKLNTFLTGQTDSNYHGQMTKEFTQPEIIQEGIPSDMVNEATESRLNNQIKSNNSMDSQGINSSLDLQYQMSDRKRMKVNLESILGLRKETTDKVHKPLTNIFNNSSYIGIIDELRRLCCFQFDVKLFMCDYSAVLYEFFYQVALSEFCNYGEITLSETLSLNELLEPLYISALNDDKKLQKKTDIILKIMNMKDMFMEYFQINFSYDADGKASILALPMLLKNVKPYLSKLPYFIYRLGSRIDYENERECLKGILREISLLYVPESISNEFTQVDTTGTSDEQEHTEEYEKQKNIVKRNELDHVLEHALFPALKQRFLATENMLGAVVQIADLPGLYKVFERC